MNDKERLQRFEEVVAELQDELASVESRIEAMKAQDKTKAATFKQLLARKMSLKQFLSAFERHGLL